MRVRSADVNAVKDSVCDVLDYLGSWVTTPPTNSQPAVAIVDGAAGGKVYGLRHHFYRSTVVTISTVVPYLPLYVDVLWYTRTHPSVRHNNIKQIQHQTNSLLNAVTNCSTPLQQNNQFHNNAWYHLLQRNRNNPTTITIMQLLFQLQFSFTTPTSIMTTTWCISYNISMINLTTLYLLLRQNTQNNLF